MRAAAYPNAFPTVVSSAETNPPAGSSRRGSSFMTVAIPLDVRVPLNSIAARFVSSCDLAYPPVSGMRDPAVIRRRTRQIDLSDLRNDWLKSCDSPRVGREAPDQELLNFGGANHLHFGAR